MTDNRKAWLAFNLFLTAEWLRATARHPSRALVYWRRMPKWTTWGDYQDMSARIDNAHRLIGRCFGRLDRT